MVVLDIHLHPVSIGVTAGIGTIWVGIGITVNTNATAVAGLSGVGTVNSLTVTNAVLGIQIQIHQLY